MQTPVVFLSPVSEHHRLLYDLTNSMVLQPTINIAYSVPQITQILINRYGGLEENWKIRKVTNAYLVSIPEWVFIDVVYGDENFWAEYYIEILPWQTLDSSNQPPPRRHVMLTIRDFPLDWWHPTYFRQATTNIGVMVGFALDTMTSSNMARVRLLMECISLDHVPPHLKVIHAGKEIICTIDMEELQEDGQDPPDQPPPDNDRNQNQALEGDNQPQLHPPPNLPQGIWVPRALPLQEQNPDQEAAPATTETTLEPNKISNLPHRNIYLPCHKKSEKEKYNKEKEDASQGEGQQVQTNENGNWSTFTSTEQKVSITVGQFSIINQVAVTIYIGQITITPQLSFAEQVNNFIATSQTDKNQGKKAYTVQKKKDRSTLKKHVRDTRRSTKKSGHLEEDSRLSNDFRAQEQQKPITKRCHTINTAT